MPLRRILFPMRPTEPLDPEVAVLLEDRPKTFVALGSDVAVNREAPIVTGDAVMDTQLENLRAMLCDRVMSLYNLTIRAKKIRLWAQHVKWDDDRQSKTIPPSLVRRDDHPFIQSLIEKAKELALINSISCEKRGEDGEMYPDAALQLKQSELRMRCTDGIDSLIKHIEKLGQDAMNQAQDLVKSFHAMAQQWKIHVTKQAAAPAPTTDLQRLASLAFRKDTPAP